MKKLTVAICIAFVAAGAAFSVKSVVNNSKESSFIKRNVEALSRTEEENGALWYNEKYHLMCCGSGNVRDCSNGSYVLCDF